MFALVASKDRAFRRIFEGKGIPFCTGENHAVPGRMIFDKFSLLFFNKPKWKNVIVLQPVIK